MTIKTEIDKNVHVYKIKSKNLPIKIALFSGIESPVSLLGYLVSSNEGKQIGDSINVGDKDKSNDSSSIDFNDVFNDEIIIKGIVLHPKIKKYSAAIRITQAGLLLGEDLIFESTNFDKISDFFRIVRFEE